VQRQVNLLYGEQELSDKDKKKLAKMAKFLKKVRGRLFRATAAHAAVADRGCACGCRRASGRRVRQG
jgi:hypothetical protein